MSSNWTRRELLRALSLGGVSAAANPLLSSCRMAEDQRLGIDRRGLSSDPRYLIVIAATGGASIIDSFLAVRQSECASASTLNTFPDPDVSAVSGSPFRAARVNNLPLGGIPINVTTDQTAFVAKHKADMLVASSIGTSVNHVIAQKRSLTGNAAWRGRTLQECVALQYGADCPIPNVNMGIGGYLERGSDDELPSYCYAENVTQPMLWPLGLSASRGIRGAPPADLLELARKTRDQKLDPQSLFARTFEKSPRLARWYQQRSAGQQELEAADLITQLNILPNLPPQVPLAEYGLGSSPDAARLRTLFPTFFDDPFEAQAALAYLLLKNRVSVAVTLGPSFNVRLAGNRLSNVPLAFDFSHNGHRATQGFMWSRVLSVIDRLVDLLKSEPLDTGSGLSMWDRTLIYVATDFGRTRQRTANNVGFGSGHDMNNGVLMLSPMLKGNTLLGGVDPSTTYTYGFDAETGAPERGKTLSNERDIFAGILHALKVDTQGSGLPDARAFRRA